MKSGALFDKTRKYRYSLWRAWNDELPRLTFVMLNPSRADEDFNDPTIKACIDFANKLGFGHMEVVNLFAYRTSDPKKLKLAPSPIGKDNDEHILEAIRKADQTIAAWGNHGAHLKRSGSVVKLVEKKLQTELLCFGTTKSGEPRHPLYIKRDIQPVTFK